MKSPTRSYVALIQDKIVGAYLIKPNQVGLGSHIANAGYMVDPSSRGQGIGEALGRHSIDEAKRLGYRAMQFNLVVSTNTVAVKLWQKLGFELLATLPQAFRHLK